MNEEVVNGELVREARYLGTFHKLECTACAYVWETDRQLWTGAEIVCPLCKTNVKVALDG